MISITLNELLNSSETFNSIVTQPFKGSLAFKIARLVRELNKEMETFNSERVKIVQKYCEMDEDGNPVLDENQNYKIKLDQIEQCNEDFRALLENKIEINAEKIPMDNIDDFNLTPQQIGNIEMFFE